MRLPFSRAAGGLLDAHCKTVPLCRPYDALLGLNPFRAFAVRNRQQEQTTLASTPADVGHAHRVAAHVHISTKPGSWENSPAPRGNINPLPFRLLSFFRKTLLTNFLLALGSPHPCPSDVDKEPFSTSVFKVLA